MTRVWCLVVLSCSVIMVTRADAPRYHQELIRTLQTGKLETVGIYFSSPFLKKETRIHPEDPLPHGFNSSLPVKVVIHGWMGNKNHITIDPVKNAYLAQLCCNVITVNWEDGAMQNYDLSRYMVDIVGQKVGELLHNFFTRTNISSGDVHILGHSLGAHIAGNIGKYFNGTIGRITALDPAGPLFKLKSTDACSSKDAIFVDAIHTDVGILGEKTRRGHVDFYPNRGFPPQPGCYLLDILTFSTCSHLRAPLLYAESILLPEQFLSVECEISELFTSIRKCRPKNNLISTTKRQMIFMGEATPKNATGVFYLETNNAAPYGKGKHLFV
ncbi:pancreatic lipase-related protein 2 [Sergentomyia squamirostris]